MRFDLAIRGGTVVTPAGTERADIGVIGGRIVALAPDLGEAGRAASSVVDATDLVVLPGIVDTHTHLRVASDAAPDRFFQDTMAAALGGTTTVLAFNNPGTGAPAEAERSPLAGVRAWTGAVAGDSAIDVGLSVALSGRMERLLDELPAMVDAGVPSAKAFLVFDFRLDERRLAEALRVLGRAGGLLEVHCEDPAVIDPAIATALQRGNTLPRYHATTRPPEAEAAATARVMGYAKSAGAPVHVVHLSASGALDAVRAARAAGTDATAETCPHYLVHDATVYDAPDPLDVARFVVSPPIRPAVDRERLWAGVADGSLSLVATDHVPDRLDTEKAEVLRGTPFNRISNGAPGIETLLSVLWSEGVERGRLTPARLVELLATAPARRFGLARKGAIAAGHDADLVLFDPRARRTIRSVDLHHTSDYTPFEGLAIHGAVRDVYLRGRPIVLGGRYVGTRGDGRLVDRIRPGAA